MRRIQFLVARNGTYAGDTSFELYGDLGSGTIDFDHPLPPGRVRLWPGRAAHVGHVLEGHLMGHHLDHVIEDGHLEGVHLNEGHVMPVVALAVRSPRYVFGRFRHAIRMVDSAGNRSAEPDWEQAVTINDSPDAPGGLRRIGWESGRLRFAFRPVRFGAVAGA